MKLILTSVFLLGAGGLAVQATDTIQDLKSNGTPEPEIKKVIIERDMGTFMVTPDLPCTVDIDATKLLQVEKTMRECINSERLWIKAI